MAKIIKPTEHKVPPSRHDAGDPFEYVIDGMNLAYTTFYAYKRLSFQGKSVAMLFGIPQVLKTIKMQENPESITVVWDGDRSAERLKLWPGYKSHRANNMTPKERKKFEKQIIRVRSLLYRMGIPQVYDKRVEGDDMIYIVTQDRVKSRRVVIWSGDKDFRQLINHDISVHNPRDKYCNSLYTFAPDFACRVDQYIDRMILEGDTSDDIPGINGIGPARAVKFLNQYDSIKAYLDNPKAEFSGMIDKDKVAEIYKRNRTLMDLAHFNKKFLSHITEITYYKDKRFPKFNEEKYRETCHRWNLRTMLDPKFIRHFKGE